MPFRSSRVLALLFTAALGISTPPLISPALAASPAAASPPSEAAKVFSQQELDELLAPIALHPDALLAQILMGSTYPLDVVEAARWRKANPKLADKALEDALAKQAWDPSVKSLATFPSMLEMMSEKLEWTQKLGDAFLGQQKAVMATVQKLRGKAKEAGSLSSTKEQTVSTATEGGTTVIKIEQANPEVVYVPTYNPAVVYGSWWYPVPPPYYYYPPGYAPGAALFTFTAGVIVGGALWGNCNWGGNDINIDVDRYNQVNHFDKNKVNNIQNGKWEHNTERRRGVPYQSEGAQQRFGGAQAKDTQARDQFRGHAESGRAEMGQGFDRNTASTREANAGNRGGAGDTRASSSDRAATRDVGGGSRDSASARAGSSERGAAFNSVSSGSRANDFSSRGSASRSNMGGARAGGGGGGGRRR